MEKPFKEVKRGGFLNDNNSLCEIKFDKDDKTIFQEAIYLGYLDTCRTIKSSTKSDVRDLLANEDPENNIACKLMAHFQNKVENIKDFDEFHHDYCEEIIKQFQDKNISLTYGQAQKITNMAFKYLCCCEETDKYDGFFKYCHMPLDSIILEWFWRETKNKNLDCPVKKNKIGSWSKMNYENNEKQYGYKFYVETIRELLDNKCPFTEEFIIWERMRKELVCEDFYFAFESVEKKEDFKKQPLEEKLTEIKNLLPKLLK